MNDFKTFIKNLNYGQDQLFQEMSLRLDSDVDILNKPSMNKIHYDNIQRNGVRIESLQGFGLPYEVYSYHGNSQNNLALLMHDKVALLVGFDSIKENVIKISFLNAHKSFRNIASKFFIDYLLPKYEEIVSDNVYTASAFKFYSNLVLRLNNFNNYYDIYIRNEETYEDELVTDIEQMKRSYGDALGHFNYCYVIKID